MLKRLTTLTLAAALILPAYSFAAPDAAVDSTESDKSDTSRDLSLKRNQEQKHSITDKNSKTQSTGVDKTKSKSEKEAGSSTQAGSLDMQVNAEVAFLKRLRVIEKQGEPFRSCQVLTHPKLARDFGFSAEIRPGFIDTIKASLLQQTASSNGSIAEYGDEAAVKAYVGCIADYGAIVRQAYKNVFEDMRSLSAKITEKKDGSIEVKGLGYDDFMTLAAGSLDRAVQAFPKIDRYTDLVDQAADCRFEGKVEQIQCGELGLTLGTRPALVAGIISIYGSGGYGGVQGTFKLSSSISYQTSLEKLKSSAKYQKMALEVSHAAEDLEAKGRSRDAVMLRKMAVERARSGKTSVGVAGLMPSIHE